MPKARNIQAKSEKKLDSLSDVVSSLKRLGSPKNIAGMARFGISTGSAYGVSVPNLRKTARSIGKNHSLAAQLWASRVHEARILASFFFNDTATTERQMDEWANDF